MSTIISRGIIPEKFFSKNFKSFIRELSEGTSSIRYETDFIFDKPYKDEKTITDRLKNYNPVLPEIKSGYQKMYVDHVMLADTGADLDFLVGKRGSEVKRHSH